MKYPTSLRQQVYKRLKGMIVGQELPPGTQLVLRNLAKQFGTSTMPVLEAIRRLEHDGLVTQIPKWGAFVKEWTDHEQMEALYIRRALEGEAARLFVLRAGQQEKNQLVALNEAFDQAAAQDLVAGLEADEALHLHIARSTGFTRLAHLIELSNIFLTMIMKAQLTDSSEEYGIRRSAINQVGCHARLVRQLLGSDTELAFRAMWDHVNGTLNALNGKLGQASAKLPSTRKKKQHVINA